MRNLWLIILMMLALVTAVKAQYKTIELKPIQKHGWNYYYDFKRVSTPEALQIPLLALNDEQIVKYYNTFEGLQVVAGLVLLAPVLYVLYEARSSYYSPNTFWAITAGSFAASMVLQVWSHNRMKLAVERYNMLLLPHPSGRVPLGNGGLSLRFRL